MEHLARAVVQALAFLELAEDTKIDSEAAVTLMDEIAETLQKSSAEERAALRRVVMEEYNAKNAAEAPEEEIDFYEHFMQDFALEEPDEEGEEPAIVDE